MHYFILLYIYIYNNILNILVQHFEKHGSTFRVKCVRMLKRHRENVDPFFLILDRLTTDQGTN
jgi:hypothetical protein